MFFRRRRAEDLAAEPLNMTPMIDVVFQLLIFFMLSMHFKEVEGKLLSQMPREKGIPSDPVTPDLREVRVVLCAGGDTALHLGDKGRHEQVKKSGEVCAAAVEKLPMGELYKTETHVGKGPANKAVYAALGSKVKQLYALVPPGPTGRPAPVIIDADSEVPYEHIIGAVNAVKAAGIETIEFAANPKHVRYTR